MATEQILEATLRQIVDELVGAGATAVVLAGSQARGDASELSDVDLYAIGDGPDYTLRVAIGQVVSVSWRTEDDEHDAMRRPRSVGGAVPGWRNARILHDPDGVAASLQAEARAFEWSTIDTERDAWVAEQVTGYAEEVLKLVAARRVGDRQLAAVQRSILALRLPMVMAVHHRLLYDSENLLWAEVADTMGDDWARAQAAALGAGQADNADDAALTMYALAEADVRDLVTEEQQAVIEVALREADARTDPYAPLKDRGWREIAEIDARLDRGEIHESGWHDAMADLIVPAYLAAGTPWEGSGKSGRAADWEYARSHVAHAIDRPGSFLDVGCANGYLLECLPRWTPYALDRYGLDIAPELVDLSRRRLPDLADGLFVGNALQWQPPRRFTYVRTGLEYVPRHRRQELVERLLGWCDRLIVGVFNEQAEARPTEDLLRGWGHRIAGRSDRMRPTKAGMEYRVLWIDAP